ncbi:hypothetical protein DNTS_033387 [Danionella cerebrum]|uniref:Ras-associating domain-containing protein n=1 Tax=Danionella cerebrum TaxID=2873325 RepID=A0A553MMU8_9TELE|nr:hypothetical protein DNTS_033387 [Danionella translucida]
MEQEESKISVWVCREEKLVSGLSKRTTCADVVKVLLEDQNFQQGAVLSGPAHSYCIVEKWRGFERTLPNKTKVLRLWNAWGEEQENVRFVLVRSDASLPNSGPRSAEARVVPSKDNPAASRNTMTFSQEKQRRIVRKAFRKLDKINRRKEETPRDRPSAEKMETLVHLIISQDHTLRQQVQRIKELDSEIERIESKVHFDRMKIHGVNYVQETYLQDQGARQDASAAQFEEYASRCEQVIQLEEELTEREALVEILTGEIQEELNHRWMRRRKAELSSKDAESAGDEAALAVTSAPEKPLLTDTELQVEEERIKTQLDTNLYVGLRLNSDLEAVKNDLDLSQELLDAKDRELRELLENIHRLNEPEGILGPDEGDAEGVPCAESVWVEQARGMSKTCGNDDDSDTGLSSMHSQDSDNAPVCESLV